MNLLNISETNITETITGYPISKLYWKPLDNIFVGQVHCPILNKPITAQWKANGKPTNSYKERNELTLKIK